MIGGALGGLLVAVFYTLVTGKLQLTKKRIVYGTPARVVVLLGILPLAGLLIYRTLIAPRVEEPQSLGLFAGTLLACVLVIYGAGWSFGEEPRT